MRQPKEKKGFFKKNRSIAISWAVSYLFILLIPIVASSFTSYYTSSVVEREVRNASSLMLSSLQSSIDKLMKAERSAFAFLYANKQQIQQLSSIPMEDPEFYYDALQLNKLLAAYRASDLSTGLCVYLAEKDYLLTGETANQSAYLHRALQLSDPGFPSYAVWKEALSASYSGSFLVSDGLNPGRSGRSLVYANTLFRTEENTVNVFLSVSLETIEELASGMSEGTLVLLDGEGIPAGAFSSAGETPVPSGLEQLPAGADRVQAGGEVYICATADSAQSGWRFALLLPKQIYWKKAKFCFLLNLGSLLAALVLGLLSALLLVRKNYRPVSGILKLMDPPESGGNEFEHIRRAWSRLEDENRTMRDALSEQTEALRERYLLSRLKGRVPKIPASESESYFGLDFAGRRFGLAALSVPPQEGAEDADELAFFAVDNVFSELMAGYPVFYKIEDGQFLFYLFPLSPEQKNWEEDCFTKADDLCGLFEDKLRLRVTAAVSRTAAGPEGIHALYQDVMDAMSYQSIIGDFGAIRTRELREPDEQRFQYREQWNRELADAVGEGNFAAASDAARKLLDNSDRRLPPSAFRLTMADSINAVLTAFYEAVSDASQRFALTSQLEKLLAGSTERSFERDFLQMLAYACSTARAAWERETTGLSTRIQEYVEAHYTDSSLNISAIAEAMGRSPKYISRVFKAETGEGLLDHINLVRVRHAKELLQEKNRTCEELAALVGYTNSRTFRRAFAKAEGITPGRYGSLPD